MSAAMDVGGQERLLLYGSFLFALGFLGAFGLDDDVYWNYMCDCLTNSCRNAADVEGLLPSELKELFGVVRYCWHTCEPLGQEVVAQAIDKDKLSRFVALWWEERG